MCVVCDDFGECRYWHIAGVWRCRGLVRVLQMLQLALAYVLSFASLYRRFVTGQPCGGVLEAELFGLFLYFVYTVLELLSSQAQRKSQAPTHTAKQA